MTYCVATMIDAGIVFASDSRTNAGIDNISTFRKMKTFERSGDRSGCALHLHPEGDRHRRFGPHRDAPGGHQRCHHPRHRLD